MSDVVKIGIIGDWARSSRGNVWRELLSSVQEITQQTFTITDFPIADLIVQPPDRSGLQDIRRQDVLIINWDAINGDPDFGSHLALRWIEHRYRELLIWARKGRLLILESQATLGVPSQAAYDAALGKGETPVSGPENFDEPLSAAERMGARCRKTKKFPTRNGFGDVKGEITCSRVIEHTDWFPGHSHTLLTEDLKGLDEGRQLYRGWFRRTLFRRSLKWVSILETADRPFLRQHSTMQVAKVDEGAIFATTINLSMTRQTKLVAAIMRCSHGATSHLPTPDSHIDRVRGYWREIVTLSAGAAAGVIAGMSEPWAHQLSTLLGHDLLADTDARKTLIKVALVPMGMALFAGGRWLIVRSTRLFRDFVGY